MENNVGNLAYQIRTTLCDNNAINTQYYTPEGELVNSRGEVLEPMSADDFHNFCALACLMFGDLYRRGTQCGAYDGAFESFLIEMTTLMFDQREHIINNK